MYIKVSWDKEFEELMLYLKLKYKDKMFNADGIGDDTLDLNKFSKSFFTNNTTTADVSVDSNSNVTAKTSVEYTFELPKPLKRLNSYFLLWKQLKKQFDIDFANKVIEMQLCGDIYINDFTDIALSYCFNYSTNDVAYNGLKGISRRLDVKPPKSFNTFIRQVEQFVVYAANSTLGATGLADILVVGSHFVRKIKETGYDGHIKVNDLHQYLYEILVNFIYTLNWEYRGNQSPFTNISVYDDYFLDNFINDYYSPIDGKPVDKEIVKFLQDIFIDAMNDELSRNPITFPVTTACFSVITQADLDSGEWDGFELNEAKDKNFVKYIAEKNKKFCFINMYAGETSQLSSC